MEDPVIKQGNIVIEVLGELHSIYKKVIDVYKEVVYGDKPTINYDAIKDTIDTLSLGKKGEFNSYDDVVNFIGKSLGEILINGLKITFKQENIETLKESAVVNKVMLGDMRKVLDYLKEKNVTKDYEKLKDLTESTEKLADQLKDIGYDLDLAKKKLED